MSALIPGDLSCPRDRGHDPHAEDARYCSICGAALRVVDPERDKLLGDCDKWRIELASACRKFADSTTRRHGGYVGSLTMAEESDLALLRNRIRLWDEAQAALVEHRKVSR